MKTIKIGILLLFINLNVINAQEFLETVQPLSPKSQKGYMYDVSKNADGSNSITFKMNVDKKSEAITYEEYIFDKNLKFLSSSDVQEKKEKREDIERTSFYAYVGGTSSFDVLSMKLKINKRVQQKKWDYEKQRYVVKKTISDETIKPKNDNGNVYYGYASFVSSDDTKNNVFALAKLDSKDKKVADQFVVLDINEQLELKENKIQLEGSYSLVYCSQTATDDVVMVFAPNKNQTDVSKYVYFRYDIQGNLLKRIEFKSPASAMLISAAQDKDDAVYLFGMSTKSDKAYEEVFKEYAPIYNPGDTNGSNKLDFKWKKSLEENMDFFHLIKFSTNQLEFASATAVSDFKAKFKTAPDDKGATAYKGKRFFIENFTVTNSGEFLVAGQLAATVKMGMENTVDSYEDIICFHFDKIGNLKAQYGIKKMNNDKKSEIFSMQQNFYLSKDGKSVYWEMLEIKGFKGYESFLDAYAGYKSYYPMYFPRIVKIDLSTNTLGSISVLGNGKYFLKRGFTSLFNESENSVVYFGSDEDFKELWIGKLLMK